MTSSLGATELILRFGNHYLSISMKLYSEASHCQRLNLPGVRRTNHWSQRDHFHQFDFFEHYLRRRAPQQTSTCLIKESFLASIERVESETRWSRVPSQSVVRPFRNRSRSQRALRYHYPPLVFDYRLYWSVMGVRSPGDLSVTIFISLMPFNCTEHYDFRSGHQTARSLASSRAEWLAACSGVPNAAE